MYPAANQGPGIPRMSRAVVLFFIVASWLTAVAPVSGKEGQQDIRGILIGRLGTKTPYDERQKQVGVGSHADEQACLADLGFGKCKAVHVWQVVRHGTRFPTAKHIKKMKMLTAWFAGEDIEKWSIPFRAVDGGLLAPRGEQELFEMGRRLRGRWPELFQVDYHPLRYDVRSSQVTRALQSAASFSHGLFHDDHAVDPSPYEHVAISSETKELDRLLRFHKACPAYLKSVKKNETHQNKGQAARLEARILKHVGDNIASKLPESVVGKVGEEPTARIKLAALVWDVCMMEHAVYERTSAFCSFLEDEDIVLLEYLDDVNTFWNKGYGFEINYSMSCELFSEMAQATLSAARSADVGPNSEDDDPVDRLATLRFAHAETLVPFVARLGLFKDADGHAPYTQDPGEETLSFHDLVEKERGRRWRAGAITPFAANVALVLHSCAQEQGKARFFVELYHNEFSVHLPASLCPVDENPVSGRPHSTLCPLDIFERAAQPIVDNCDLDVMCTPLGQ